MNLSNLLKNLWLPGTILVLYLTAVWFRPLLPIDETRYMSVAWEMLLRQGWLQPLTMNFEPYHHKPPLLFWLINLSWSAFGVSRWAGLITPVLASLSCVYLTGILGRLLFPETLHDRQRVWLIMAASLPFMIYGTLVMFDLTLCAFVLLSLISTILFAQHRQLRYAALAGLFLGLGVLTKGPVAYLYVLPVIFLAPLWVQEFTKPKSWYMGCFLAILISFIPVLFWLIPILQASDNDFAFWLIWNQTAGRVTGNFSASHARPVYFYLPLIPIMFMPWILFPDFWRFVLNIKTKIPNAPGLKFLLLWLIPVVISFSLISGKQPHYLVPLLPGIVLLLTLILQRVKTKVLAHTLLVIATIFVCGQIVASKTIFQSYDLKSIADIVRSDPDRPLAFARDYHAEIGFLARRKAPLDQRQMDEIDVWLEQHPDGWAIIRYKNSQDVEKYKMIESFPYRGKNLGIFSKKMDSPQNGKGEY